MKGKELKGTYAVLEDGSLCEFGNTCDDDTKVTIKLTGNIPTTESIVEIKDGAVLSGTIIIEDYTLTYNSEKLEGKIEVKEESN